MHPSPLTNTHSPLKRSNPLISVPFRSFVSIVFDIDEGYGKTSSWSPRKLYQPAAAAGGEKPIEKWLIKSPSAKRRSIRKTKNKATAGTKLANRLNLTLFSGFLTVTSPYPCPALPSVSRLLAWVGSPPDSQMNLPKAGLTATTTTTTGNKLHEWANN